MIGATATPQDHPSAHDLRSGRVQQCEERVTIHTPACACPRGTWVWRRFLSRTRTRRVRRWGASRELARSASHEQDVQLFSIGRHAEPFSPARLSRRTLISRYPLRAQFGIGASRISSARSRAPDGEPQPPRPAAGLTDGALSPTPTSALARALRGVADSAGVTRFV